jgi:ATPase family AAA domain-containing protein 2
VCRQSLIFIFEFGYSISFSFVKQEAKIGTTDDEILDQVEDTDGDDEREEGEEGEEENAIDEDEIQYDCEQDHENVDEEDVDSDIEEDDASSVRRSERLRTKCINYAYKSRISAPQIPSRSGRKKKRNHQNRTLSKKQKSFDFLDRGDEMFDWEDDYHFEKEEDKRVQKIMGSIQPINFASPSKPNDNPLIVDHHSSFNEIGGHTTHIKSLKEMILLPLLYPEVFAKFHISPPRGVIFHGPPGTGKTLMARALANSCTVGNQKISFFMRKGADCLSKVIYTVVLFGLF